MQPDDLAELKARMTEGGLREAVVRSAIHVAMSHASFDERGFELVRRIRAMSDGTDRLPLPAFKALIREAVSFNAAKNGR